MARKDYSEPLVHRFSRQEFDYVFAAPTEDGSAIEVKTADFNLSAFLLYQEGAELVRLVPIGTIPQSGRPKYDFVIWLVPDANVQALCKDFTNAKTLVEPRAFIAAQGKLRDAMYGRVSVDRRGKDGEKATGETEDKD